MGNLTDIGNGKKLEDTKKGNEKVFMNNGALIHISSVSDEDFAEFMRRYIEQTKKIDSLSPEEQGNRKAQLEKCIKGTGKKK